jgi:cytochrome c oxidase subunit 3
MIPQARATTTLDTASGEQRRLAAQLGMWVFLATELMLFGPLFLGYLYGRSHFPDAFAAASRHTEFWLGTINTAILLSSSLAVALAVAANERGAPRVASRWLLLAAGCGIAFLVIKGTEYHIEWDERLFPGAGFAPALPASAELFYFLYFAMTALHALHLAIGVTATLVFALGLRLRTPALLPPIRLELVGLYWHFVDAVWIFLYPILYLVGRGSGKA